MKTAKRAVRATKTSPRPVARSRNEPVSGAPADEALASARAAENAVPGAEVQPTTVAAEALRTGVVPLQASARSTEEAIPGSESETIRAGDPDASALQNEYSGEETPGGSTPTPDQNRIDDIGRAYGVAQEDAGELHSSAELLDRRDKRRTDS